MPLLHIAFVMATIMLMKTLIEEKIFMGRAEVHLCSFGGVALLYYSSLFSPPLCGCHILTMGETRRIDAQRKKCTSE